MGGAEVTGPQLQSEVEEAGGMPFRRDVPVAFLGRRRARRLPARAVRRGVPGRAGPRGRAAAPRLRPAAGGDGPARAARARARGERRGLLRRAARQAPALRGQRGPRLHADEPDRPRPRAAPRAAGPVRGPPLLPRRGGQRLRRPAARLDLAPRGGRDPGDGAVREAAPGRARGPPRRRGRRRGGGGARRPPGLLDVPGAPPVVRDQLVQPYVAGLAFARALWAHGGPEALREAWGRPPESTEQVLHPAQVLRARAAASGRARRRGRRAERGSSRRASWESCSCGRSRRGEQARRRRAGAATGGGCGTSGEGRRSPGAASGTRPADAGEFHAALRARFARAGARTGAGRVRGLLRRARPAVRACAEPETRWSCCPPTTRGCSTRLVGRRVGAEVACRAPRHVRLPPAGPRG